MLIVVAAAPIAASDVAARLADLPAYARPAGLIFARPDAPGLLYPAGTPNRAVAADLIDARAAHPFDTNLESFAS